ncbi:cupin domain-containing protein [Mucilaginibacter myungsuensis]|uniref:Cupin domain-containing protein n=1 Tax=Mucilaginibacter myungsuensis TaxID=649104 RepID=A0A929L0S9_9SPHI|nr:cupin domain-containing protein [Mucilaginibacter myungsuensis]MBE9664142.1 cupin domain-containing protein [Mucilaginibacter myungsuensis]MDN3601321.1 cupin domain-containing protein [Mucilaginibacter myungsuensis]
MNADQGLFHQLLAHIAAEPNAHARGMKQVFTKNSDTDSALTQFAYGVMSKGDRSGRHSHATMDEYFFFIKGKGIYHIADELIDLLPTTFVRIPAGTEHELINDHNEPLEFVYFGVALYA